LIELLVVVAIVALSSALVTLALRDPDADQLEQEAQRLIVLLETARAESRTAGVGVQWAPLSDEDRAAIQGTDFRFVGLTTSTPLPTRWLDQETRADLVGQRTLTLGPEPFIGPQRVVLRLGDRRLSLATDGLAPFAVQDEPASP
jgi:general secretion pathway protein H